MGDYETNEYETDGETDYESENDEESDCDHNGTDENDDDDDDNYEDINDSDTNEEDDDEDDEESEDEESEDDTESINFVGKTIIFPKLISIESSFTQNYLPAKVLEVGEFLIDSITNNFFTISLKERF